MGDTMETVHTIYNDARDMRHRYALAAFRAEDTSLVLYYGNMAGIWKSVAEQALAAMNGRVPIGGWELVEEARYNRYLANIDEPEAGYHRALWRIADCANEGRLI